MDGVSTVIENSAANGARIIDIPTEQEIREIESLINNEELVQVVLNSDEHQRQQDALEWARSLNPKSRSIGFFRGASDDADREHRRRLAEQGIISLGRM